MIKKIILIVCACLLSSLNFVGVKALDTSNENLIGVLELDSENGKDLTFEEMVAEIAKDEGCTYDEALKAIVEDVKHSSNSSIIPLNNAVDDNQIIDTLSTLKYRTDTANVFSKNKKYAAGLKFYYSYTGTTASRHIVQLLHVTLDCTVESTYRSFNGSLFVHLETNYKVHYILNGAFYNTGTKTNSAGLSLGIGKSATITLGASSTTNFYDGIYAEGNLWTARQ